MHFGVFKAFANLLWKPNERDFGNVWPKTYLLSAGNSEIPRVSDISGVAKYVASSGHKTWKHVPQVGPRPKAFYSKILQKKSSFNSRWWGIQKHLKSIAADIAASVPVMEDLINQRKFNKV